MGSGRSGSADSLVSDYVLTWFVQLGIMLGSGSRTLKGTIDFLKEDLTELEDLLHLNELTSSHNGGGYRKVDDRDKFEKTLNDAINLIFKGHSKLQEGVIPMLKSKREIAAEEFLSFLDIEDVG